jgi:TPR repeat protein
MIRFIVIAFVLIASEQVLAQRQKLHLMAGKLHYALLEFDKAKDNFLIATTHRKTRGEAYFYLGRMATLGEGEPVNHTKAVQYYKAGSASKFLLNYLGLALAYKYGDGVRQNVDSANFYFKQVPFLTNEKYEFTEAFELYYYALCLYNGHYVRANKPASMAHFQRVWDIGMLHAGHYLASCYYEGCRGEIRQDSAVIFWSELAKRNYKPAMQNMASCYLHGIGVPKDSLRAADMYYQMGELHNDSDAALEASLLYLHIGARKDTAIKVLQNLAAKGSGKAATELGHVYFNGVHLKRSYIEAAKWYEVAAKSFNHEAIFALATMHEEGRGVATDYTKALELYKQAALLGNAAAMYQAGYMNEMGKGCEVNYCEAVMWYEKAAKMYHAQAIFRLGLCTFFENRCVRNDTEYAITLFEQAAGLGETSAALNLALIYSNGLKVPKDALQANFWLRETIRQSPNNPTALFYLGKSGFELQELNMSANEALSFLVKSGELGNPEAYTFLAKLYEEGKHLPMQWSEALGYLKKLPPSMKTEEQIATLYAKGHKTLPRDNERALMHLFQAFALAGDTADEHRLKLKMKQLGKLASVTRLHQIFEQSTEMGGLGLSHNEADELIRLMRKQGILP